MRWDFYFYFLPLLNKLQLEAVWNACIFSLNLSKLFVSLIETRVRSTAPSFARLRGLRRPEVQLNPAHNSPEWKLTGTTWLYFTQSLVKKAIGKHLERGLWLEEQSAYCSEWNFKIFYFLKLDKGGLPRKKFSLKILLNSACVDTKRMTISSLDTSCAFTGAWQAELARF